MSRDRPLTIEPFQFSSRQCGVAHEGGQAVRKLLDDDERRWRPLMEPKRRVARRLVGKGKIIIIQRGKMVDPYNDLVS